MNVGHCEPQNWNSQGQDDATILGAVFMTSYVATTCLWPSNKRQFTKLRSPAWNEYVVLAQSRGRTWITRVAGVDYTEPDEVIAKTSSSPYRKKSTMGYDACSQSVKKGFQFKEENKMETDLEYWIAYNANLVYCATHEIHSFRELEENVWPLLLDPIDIRLEVFRVAARDVLLEMRDRESDIVLDNEEAATILAAARSSISC